MTKKIDHIFPVPALFTCGASTLVACGGDFGTSSTDLLGAIESGTVVLDTKFDQLGRGLKQADGTMAGLDVDVATYVVNHIADTNGWSHPEVTWCETPSAQRETLI